MLSLRKGGDFSQAGRKKEATNQIVTSMIQSQLAARLGFQSSNAVAARRGRADFPEWSQKLDPEGKAWRYDSESKQYSVIVD